MYSRQNVNKPALITIAAPIRIILSIVSEKIMTPISEAKTSCKYENGWITENGLVVVETGKNDELVLARDLKALDERIYGTTKIMFLQLINLELLLQPLRKIQRYFIFTIMLIIKYSLCSYVRQISYLKKTLMISSSFKP